MSHRVFNVGIAGYGVVGKRRRACIDEHPNFKTVAICDLCFENSLEDFGDISTYTDYTKMLEQEQLDVLFVCLPNNIAPIVTIAGLGSGLHVFCEKPPGRTVDDISKVMEAELRAPNLKLMYGFNHRYHGSVKKALEVISSGELGEIINLRGVYGKSRIISKNSDWRSKRELSGGGILLDQGIHMVDLMRMFAGNFSEYKSFVDSNFWNYDVEDNAYALMKTKSGVVAFLNSSATQWRHRFNLEISLTKGAITLSGILSSSKSYGPEKIIISYPNESENEGEGPREVTVKYDEDNSWCEETNYFASCILNDSKVEQGTSSDAFETMKAVYNIYLADEEWKLKHELK